jgi:hypothetical protein
MGLNEKSMYLEDKLKLYKESEARNEELKRNFQSVIDENDEMKSYIDDLQKELHNKEDLTKEWQEVLENIKKKIISLEEENQGFHHLDFFKIL